MNEHIENADGEGQLVIANERLPVSYRVVALRDAGQYQVQVSLLAPREWLLEQGFEQEVALERENGQRMILTDSDGQDVNHGKSVTLTCDPVICASRHELVELFPEIDIARMHRM